LMPTTSIDSLMAATRMNMRPILPKPLIATRIFDIIVSVFLRTKLELFPKGVARLQD
jgi:hypothetical protein